MGGAGGAPTTGAGGVPSSNGGTVSPSNGGAYIGGGATTGSGGRDAPQTCASFSQKPETIFIDASVTDTIVTYSPIALYVMIDRSASMVGFFGDATSWPNASAALGTFVHDPASAGLDIGLAVFPPMSNNNTPDCAAGVDCGAPLVPIGPLPANAAAIENGLTQANPQTAVDKGTILTTPTECGLRGMINHCIDYQKQATEKCVAILVTDGAPSSCDTNPQNLADIVAAGSAAGVQTFTLGLPGSNTAFLDQLALAGGTNKSIPITTGAAGQKAFIDALTAIRGKVSTQTSTQVKRPVTTPLSCQWTIPPPQDGKPLDPNLVNLELVPVGGAPQTFLNVPTEGACSGNNTWHYDVDVTGPNPPTPTQVILCPDACAVTKAATGATVNIVFGCAIKVRQVG
jgi:hypothetical protein